MARFTKAVPWVLVVLLLVMLIATITPADEQRQTRVLITAAHLGQIDGYQRVYCDEEDDYAIYLRPGSAIGDLDVGASVRLAGTEGVVLSVSDAEFTVDVKNVSKIVPGVSGSPVYRNSSPVGFISGWNGQGSLRCIFY